MPREYCWSISVICVLGDVDDDEGTKRDEGTKCDEETKCDQGTKCNEKECSNEDNNVSKGSEIIGDWHGSKREFSLEFFLFRFDCVEWFSRTTYSK